MNLTELCSAIPKTILTGSDAMMILMKSYEVASKVYKGSKIVFATNLEQDKLVQKAIDYILKKQGLNSKAILWKGSYGESGKSVVFWAFMTGVVITRGIDGFWSFAGPNITKRRWEILAKEV